MKLIQMLVFPQRPTGAASACFLSIGEYYVEVEHIGFKSVVELGIVPDRRMGHFTVDTSLTSTIVVCAAQVRHQAKSDSKADTSIFFMADNHLRIRHRHHLYSKM
jgi:hypothetical protein